MQLVKIFPKAKSGRLLRRKGDPDPTLRYRIVENARDLDDLIALVPAFEPARADAVDARCFPLLLEAWDGGVSWSSDIPLGMALDDAWEVG